MAPWRTHHVEVHLFRRTAGNRSKSNRGFEFLLLRRASGRRLKGVWQPVTGKARPGETLWSAAAREVLEETGIRPLRWWALEHLTLYYEPGSDAFVALPVFAAELPPRDRVRLSDEHDAHVFAKPAAAARRVLWDAQRAAIAAVRRELFAHPALARGARASHPRDITDLVAGAAAKPRRARPTRSAARPTPRSAASLDRSRRIR